MFPPIRAALMPHIVGINFICLYDKSYNKMIPPLPPIDESGLIIEEALFVSVKSLSSPAPKAVIELAKCGCKSGF